MMALVLRAAFQDNLIVGLRVLAKCGAASRQ
jgi:hypothetical protein